MNFIYIIFIVLQWSWGMIQNIIGLIMFIFMSEQCPKDVKHNLSLQETFERTKVHEYGHTIQSIILGPLFLLVIGIPSCMWANIPSLKQYRKSNKISYYSFYPERWANYLGEQITKSKSMGQAIIDF